ncbi:MAG: hypothetical protein ACK4MF_10095 [Hyphomicrobiaceae bacterium]
MRVETWKYVALAAASAVAGAYPASATQAPTTQADCDALIEKVTREISRRNIDVYYPLGTEIMQASCIKGDFNTASTVAREIYRRRTAIAYGRSREGLPNNYPDSVPRPASPEDCRRLWEKVEPAASAFLDAEGLANFEAAAFGDVIVALCDAKKYDEVYERMRSLLQDTVKPSRARP